MPIVPETKSWTWVLERRCPECGFDASATDLSTVPALARENARLWPVVLARPDVTARPDDSTWAPLEYAAHVRDVFRTMVRRLTLILEQDDPEFPNWDQDATAVQDRYLEQDPTVVAAQIAEEAERFAALVETTPKESEDRTGRRSDGSVFTFSTLARYAVHDPIHHAHDVGA